MPSRAGTGGELTRAACRLGGSSVHAHTPLQAVNQILNFGAILFPHSVCLFALRLVWAAVKATM